jgi:hypothetical protein
MQDEIKGTLTLDRVDGNIKNFTEQTTKEKAVKQLEMMKQCYPEYYTVTGGESDDGVIDVKFTAHTKMLHSLVFRFVPDELQSQTAVQ